MKKHLLTATKSIFIVVMVLVANFNSRVEEISLETGVNNRVVDLTTMALKLDNEIKNDIYSAKDTYTGSLTGYGANCALCTGKLACKSDYYVMDGTDTYQDEIYGTVKIVASSKNLPCGTVIRFNASSISSDPIIAIVLDRGVLGSDIDLLTPSEEYAYNYVGRKTITYDVLRQGWN